MKYQNLLTLQSQGYQVSKLHLYSGGLDFLKNRDYDHIIIRSSYRHEDTATQSMAGVFTSVGPIDRDDINNIKQGIETVKSKAQSILDSIQGSIDDFDIIIQQYITTNCGGVAIVHEDKIMIELAPGQGAESVTTGNKQYSYYQQGPCVIQQGDLPCSKQQLTKLITIIKQLKSQWGNQLDIEIGLAYNTRYIFQVRPLISSPFQYQHIIEHSNIGENFPEQVSNLTGSFYRMLYKNVYQSVMYYSGVAQSTIAATEHVFDNLVTHHEGTLYYNLVNRYKMMLLVPGSNKRGFDSMIGSGGDISYLVIDDIKSFLPNLRDTIYYIGLVGYKILTFSYRINRLGKKVRNFCDYRKCTDLSTKSSGVLLEELQTIVQQFAHAWYVTIDNDFVIMKLANNLSLGEIKGLYSVKQLDAIRQLGSGTMSFETYVDQFGHRFGNELTLEQEDITDHIDDFILYIQQDIHTDQGSDSLNKKISRPLSYHIKNREQFRIYRSEMISIVRKYLIAIAPHLIKAQIITNTQEIYNYQRHDLVKIIQQQSVSKISHQSHTHLIGSSFQGKCYIMDNFHLPTENFDILVTKHFDPGWIVLLQNIKGIIVENGTLLSHIAILCREKNIPLLIGAQGATSQLAHGSIIQVNPDTSIITT